MVHQAVLQLSERFHRLELHAAQSGRETLRTLTTVVEESRRDALNDLIDELHDNIRFLLGSLPPYAPPLYYINRTLLVLEDAQENGLGVGAAKRELGELGKDTTNPHANHEKMAQHLLGFLPQDAIIYTHTLSETVLGVLVELHRLGRLGMVIVSESRPNNDGWDTAKRLAERNLEVHLTIDAAMPEAIESSQLMLSGAEIINRDGSVIGKIGARTAAFLCQLYRKPVFIVADSSKINGIPWDNFCPSRISPEALGIDFALPSLQVTGSYFDKTPSDLIHAYATEIGVIRANEIQSLVSDRKVSRWLTQQATARSKQTSR